MKSLESLRGKLKTFSLFPSQAGYDSPVQLQQYVERRQKKFDSPVGVPVSKERMNAALRRLLASSEILNFSDLKHVCYGLANEVGASKQSVISSPSATAALFKRLEAIAAKKNELQTCYKGLLSAYFAIDGRTAGEHVKANWIHVRTFLRENLWNITSKRFVPKWANVLFEHENIFSDEPCGRYADQILSGKKEEFEAVTDALGVRDQSWLFRDAALAAIEAATKMPHREFQHGIPLLLELIEQHELIRGVGLGRILRRYAEIPGRPEHPELLRLSISIWHNPLFKRNLKNWHVAGDEATGMVSHWLKSTLIEEFFEHLVTDRDTDKRRAKFWKRYIGSIENMFFALGSKARTSQDKDVIRLRSMMGDAKLRLEGGGSSNNGFFMIMKDRVIAEFGEKGYAVYIFHQVHLPFRLEGDISVQGRSEWRELPRVHYLMHKDNVNYYARWEERFENVLRSDLGVQPDDRGAQKARRMTTATAPESSSSSTRGPVEPQSYATPDASEIRALCVKFGVAFVDDKEARQWIVRASKENAALSKALTERHFSFNKYELRWERNY